MKTETRDIEVAKVTVTNKNARKINKNELKSSDLRRSVKDNGVQVPIMVNKNGGDKFELMAGERRLTICKELGIKKIPAVIYHNLTDEQKYDKMHFENASREDLNPLEQAQDAQNLMKIFKGDVKAIASKLGISERHVRMRVAVNKLSAEWKKYIDAGEHNFTIAHLELIARQSKDIQAELYDERYDFEDRPVKYLEESIDRNYEAVLSESEFDKKGCEKCKKRSDAEAVVDMFHGEEKQKVVKCLDVECFKKKKAEHLKQSFAELSEKYPGLQVVTNSYTERRECEAAGISVADTYEKSPCKKADKGAFPVITFGKTNVRYLKDDKPASASSRPVDKDGNVKPKTMKERREDLRGLRLKMVSIELQQEVLESKIPVGYKLLDVTALAVALGSQLKGAGGYKHFKNLKAGKKIEIFLDWNTKPKMTLEEAVWASLRGDLRNVVRADNGADAVEKEKTMKEVAKVIGFDFEKSFKKAVADKPEPKGWANLNPDGTVKSK